MRKRHLVAMFLEVLLVLCFAQRALASDSPYALQIIQPQAGLTTANRFYKAYPGLVYDVRAAVIGGAYPYKYSLDTAPAGMSINASTGEIAWPSPVAQTNPYPVTLRVTDGAGATQTVSWTILVTTQLFLFVDPVSGTPGASGTINDPVQGFADVYGGTTYASKYATTMQNYFVYFRDGATYIPNGYTNGTAALQWTSNQPLVWIAYPGTHPVIDVSTVFFQANDTLSNFYVDGFEIQNITAGPTASEYQKAFQIGSSASNVTFRNNVFHNLPATAGSYNQSAIMIGRDNTSGLNWAFQNNEFYDINVGYGLLGYVAQNVLVEDNYFHEINSAHAIGPKIGTSYWFIRHNKVINSSGYGIWLMYEPFTTNSQPYGNMEVSYNYVQMVSGNALDINLSLSTSVGPAYLFRNTFVGSVAFEYVDSTVGPYYFSKNVSMNSQSSSGGYSCNGCANAPNNVVTSNNLVGSAGIVDTNGLLTAAYAQYVGQIGWQTSISPLAPVLKVQ